MLNSNPEKYILPRSLDIEKSILITGEKYSFNLSKSFIDLGAVELFHSMLASEINRYSTIIGFGGGKTLDEAKRIAFEYDKNLILIPSIISNDGIASPMLSYRVSDEVVYKKADIIIWDYVLEYSFPLKYFSSAFGDIFSSYSAINDFIRFSGLRNKSEVFKLLRMIDLFFEKDLSIQNTINIIEHTGEIISNQKTSHPVSGAEHKIAHAIDSLGLLNNVLHGDLVGSISLFTIYLQGSLNEKFLRIADRIKLKKCFTHYDDTFRDNLPDIFKLSKSIRKDRPTILDFYSPHELVDEFHKFEYAIFDKLILQNGDSY